jgi:hypothetical protein
VVFIGASLSREVGWSLARHIFDPPPSFTPSSHPASNYARASGSSRPRTPGNDPYCQPYSYVDSDAGEWMSQASAREASALGMHKDSSVAKGVHTDRVPSHSVKHDNTTTTATTIDPDWSYAAFQRVASAGAWPSFRCTKGLARGAGSGSASTGCRMTPPARPEKGFYTPDTGFQFARTEEECCGARGTAHFWQELVQLDDPVRFAGGRKQPGKEHHHEMIPRLMRHLAANCPCRGVVWLGIGAHELKHGRPWYQDPSTIEYGPREWQREAESKWCVSLLRAAAAARGGGGGGLCPKQNF